ncbi:WD40 repeat 2 [Cordyceps javanica]|nr:WD40 repeat 2 [Cordyceps javanica]
MAWRALKAIEESHRPVQWPWYKRLWKSLRRRIVGKSKDADEERGKEPLKAPDHSNKWTMTHCYYANMGGFVYIKGGKKVRLTADEPAAPPFVQQHRPEIFKEDIQDKSKQDWLAKTWAGFQILQLILSVVTRSIQHVRFSQLEMVTLSFAVCGVLIYITNIHKPQNVGRDTQIKTEIASSKGSKDSFSITPTHDSLWAILRNKRNHDVDNNNSEQYAPRIPNDSIPFNESNHIVHPVVYLLAGSSALFGLIHAIAWSFEFPTPQEKLLWRIATGISAVSPVLGLLAIPIVQLTRSAGDPELFVGKCLRLLQQYRWHHPGQYHVSESIANLEEVLKGLLLSDEIPKLQYSQILMIESGASTMKEAVTAYYDNPYRYSSSEIASDKKRTNAPPAARLSNNDHLPTYGAVEQSTTHSHTNAVMQAATLRAQDEQQMQNMLQNVQFRFKLYNPDLEPEHELDAYCGCLVHQYKRKKWERRKVQTIWSKAVMYPGEKAYDNLYTTQLNLFTNNPYRFTVGSPYFGYGRDYTYSQTWDPPRPRAHLYTEYVRKTIELNAVLNVKAQFEIDAKEPSVSIWEVDDLAKVAAELCLENKGREDRATDGSHMSTERVLDGAMHQRPPNAGSSSASRRSSWFKKMVSRKSLEEKEAERLEKLSARYGTLRNSILQEEHARWPSQKWRQLVTEYQGKVGMTRKIAELREKFPIQYLHLLCAGYFEPIPVAWADQASNPLKFRIEGIEGWRGITPTWRGYEDTAEERLYWVLNHREGMAGQRLKPDMISALNMARQRMASAVEPPPQYFSATDTCHIQHTSEGYSKQVMAPPFQAFDAPETVADDTMILLDVSASMDFDPMRPNYNEYLITGYTRSTQPKNRDVAKAIIRRFVDAMINHSHDARGYQLTTFANHATYMGIINHSNFESVWRSVEFGGGTRVMTGWQRVKRLHFEKHRESATFHPVYGWQAGPKTPMLRLLLLLDGEATDMDEFELDLLGNSWAHVTIFLIGVDGCPHHHRHANELQRISEVNRHVSFVDAVGNMPERLVTHELLKRHLGYEVSMVEDDWRAATLTIRELFMLWFTEQITNKPNWQSKIFDKTIVCKWRAEVDNVDWFKAIGYHHQSPCSDAMWKFMIAELKDKAKLYEETGMIPVFDTSAAVIKSDIVISAELKEELKAAAASLEQNPEAEKDWQPRSDEKVLNLVHPSLWPLVYGRSRIVSDKPVTLENCLQDADVGEVISAPARSNTELYVTPQTSHTNGQSPWSQRFQWLPCEVEIDGSTPKIVSYINNLHPSTHQGLYGVIERLLENVLPLWDLVYRWPTDFSRLRIPCPGPEPHPYEETDVINAGKLRYFNFFPMGEAERPGSLGWPVDRIQVIVKLANIHLSPEKPTYDGGSWHIEGQLNERICATAIYYYDSENITQSHLAFRTRADRETLMTGLSYRQDDYDSITATLGIDAKGDTLQALGKVLTREGRLIAFPNLYQHRVSPFELKDRSKPGHRKILALFLVDPKIPVISTACVPPQQAHWWAKRDDDDAPNGWPISLEEAQKTRLELMDERTTMDGAADEALREDQWNFCEH